MSDDKATLLRWIDQDRSKLVAFLSRFLQARSPNPPGDTRAAADHVGAFLKAEGLHHRVVAPHQEMPNFIASCEGSAPGRHLVLNGHIDVFPAVEEGWTHGPWSGAVTDDHIWGRGAVDMKCGTTASLFAYAYLHRLNDHWPGRLTLTAVSDEETFGPWGARYLMENHPEVHGECCLSGEPSDRAIIRFGEKGPLWLKVTIRTAGAHGAYPHMSESATKIAARIIAEFDTLGDMDIPPPENLAGVLDASAEVIERAFGTGASQFIRKVTFNAGTIHGGLKVNMIPAECVLEADFRLPIGLSRSSLVSEIGKIVARHPEASVEELQFSEPNWSDPEHDMVRTIKANVSALQGFEPRPAVGLGGTDTRLWRYRGIPAYVYGPSPHTMGKTDERIRIDEFLHIVRIHTLSAYDYLKGMHRA